MTLTQWQGTEVATSQVDSITIGGTPTEDDVYNILIGGIIVCTFTALSSPTATTVRDGLRDAWDLATGTAKLNPYSALLTSADKSTDALTLTTKIKGWPFTITVSKTGVGTITQATDTEPLGPNFADHAANWSNGLPANDYDVVLANSAIDMCWGLEEQSAVTCATMKIKKSYTGRIGLRRNAFAITANGKTYNPNAMEYRPLYWKIGTDILEIGAGSGAGSDRIKFWQNEGSPDGDTFIKGTASKPADVGLPVIRLRGETKDIHINSAIGGVGLAVEEPEYNSTTREEMQLNNVFLNDPSLSTTVRCGDVIFKVGDKLWVQYGGTSSIRVKTGETFSFIGHGGVATFEFGNYVITSIEGRGATIIDKHSIVVAAAAFIVTVGASVDIGDEFEVYCTVPQWFEESLLGAGRDGDETLGYMLLGKYTATTTSANTTASALKDAIQETIDNGPLALLALYSTDTITLTQSPVSRSKFTLKTRTVNGGATDDQTLLVTGLATERFSTLKIDMYSGLYDATRSTEERWIEHIEFHGKATAKLNDNSHVDRITRLRELTGI